MKKTISTLLIISLTTIIVFFLGMLFYKSGVPSLWHSQIKLVLKGRGVNLEPINDLLQDCQTKINDIKFSVGFLSNTTNTITHDYRFELPLPEAVINNKIPTINNDQILIIGHVYGDPNKKGVTTPSETLINAVPEINALSPGLIVLLGDMTYIPDNNSINDLKTNFLNKLISPIINANGDHDGNCVDYLRNFGQTYYYFKYNNSLIIVLDSIIADCFIVGRQETMLKEALSSALDNPEINNILIFTHRLIFLDSSQPLSNHVNARCLSSNFRQLLENHFAPAAKEKPIYLFSGDVGAFGGGRNLSPYYKKIPNQDIFLIATGLGDGLYDKVILADISSSKLSFKIISLNGEDTFPLEKYDHEYWTEYYDIDDK